MTLSCFNDANVEDLFESEYDFCQKLSDDKSKDATNWR